MNDLYESLSFGRPLRGSKKLQRLYGALIRNKRIQMRKLKQSPRHYLNVGCGPNINNKFINLDYFWTPALDLCWDITKSLPFDDNTLNGVYAEHCLEHISFSSCQKAIGEFFRILRPGGVIRIVVPDAELYMNLYVRSKNGEAVRFPYVTDQDIEEGYTPIMSVNRVFRNHGHHFAYDFETLSMMLCRAGFIDISKASYMQGRNSDLLIDSEKRRIESLYIEASKSE